MLSDGKCIHLLLCKTNDCNLTIVKQSKLCFCAVRRPTVGHMEANNYNKFGSSDQFGIVF